MIRGSRNLDPENVDFDLTPAGPQTVQYWLEDPNSASGGFNVFRYRRSEPME